MNQARPYLSLPLLAALLCAAGACAAPSQPATVARTSLSVLLSGPDDEGFARALTPRPFVFPRDHGPHSEFRSEWWYVTGNLESTAGDRFGYQVTFFRFGLAAEKQLRASAWAATEIYMAHFALTDVAADRFHSRERFSRGALGLAGATDERVWLESWSLDWREPNPPSFTLRAGDEAASVELILEARKPIVLHGDDGLSRKGRQPGNASYYYSATRIETAGRVKSDGRTHVVQGTSWLDREWSTNVLEAQQIGWDWFALQLDDDSELMFYRLRRRGGAPDAASSGSYVELDGTVRRLGPDDVTLRPTDTWRSPHTRAVYPAAWQLSVPDLDLSLEVRPVLADQEHANGRVIYWEGAVSVAGRRGDRPLAGAGYVELVGYDEDAGATVDLDGT